MGAGDGAIVGTTKIVDNGPDSERYNIVVVAEGYQAGELAQFATHAQDLASTLAATAPFDRLMPGVNVHRLDVSSTDSGADDPAGCGGTGAAPATFFDASFCTAGIRRLLVVDSIRVVAAVNAEVPAWHAILVIVNSPIYGGSGGQIGVYSLAPGADEIALHEMGHSAFGLADEYDYWAGCGVDTDRDSHPAGEPIEPNVTLDSDRATIKWRDLIDPATAMPTTANPDCTACDRRPSPVPARTVGAFEGARYYHCGAYRPDYDCRMRALGFPFCAVCERVIEQALQPFQPNRELVSLDQAAWVPGTTTYRFGFRSIPNIPITGEPPDADAARWAMLHDGSTYRLYGFRQGSDDRLYQFGFDGASYAFGHRSIAELTLVDFPADTDASSFAMLHDGSAYRLYLRRHGDPRTLHQAAWVPGTAAYRFGFRSIPRIPVVAFPGDTDWERWGMLHDGSTYRFYAFRSGSDDRFYQGAFDPSAGAYRFGFRSIDELSLVGTPAGSDTRSAALLHDGSNYRFYFQTR